MNKLACIITTALVGSLAATAHASEANWPTRAVTLVVPFNAGGATDAVARMLAEQLQKKWQQPVVVENKPGAGTIIGTNTIARAQPDGYTMGLVVSAHTINPSLRSNLP